MGGYSQVIEIRKYAHYRIKFECELPKNMGATSVLFAKTPARREINNIAAAISPPFCYKS
jgi:hypothetical protein